MNRLHCSITILMALALVLAVGCKRNASVDTNVTPKANAGLDQELEYDGEPVEVTLDGSESNDPDGRITKYIWRSDDPDAADHPANEEKPEVTLEMGWYSFTLWVEDNRGHTSEPDSVVIAVGVPIDQGPPSGGDGDDDDGGAEPGGGDVVCNGEMCSPVMGAAGELPPCCDMDSGGGCGAQVSMTDPTDCEAINQPGELDPSCPDAMSVVSTVVPGCCTPEGKCGVMSGTLMGCVERTDYPPAFLMGMMQLDEIDCGG